MATTELAEIDFPFVSKEKFLVLWISLVWFRAQRWLIIYQYHREESCASIIRVGICIPVELVHMSFKSSSDEMETSFWPCKELNWGLMLWSVRNTPWFHKMVEKEGDFSMTKVPILRLNSLCLPWEADQRQVRPAAGSINAIQ